MTTYQEIADYCRAANMGYRDGTAGGPEDVAHRIEELERFGRLDGSVVSRFMSNPAIVELSTAMESERLRRMAKR